MFSRVDGIGGYLNVEKSNLQKFLSVTFDAVTYALVRINFLEICIPDALWVSA